MSRGPRKLSRTGIYHVVIRGIDKLIIFESPKDYEKYLDLLSMYKVECNFDILAYCLMTNHVHLIIKINTIPLETIFRKLNTHYATWFNMKYQRIGHLQQERYYSEPIEDASYLLTAIRYVHQNPLKAGLENSPGTNYVWSSIHEYISGKSVICNISFIASITSISKFIQYNFEHNSDELTDINNLKIRLPDDVAKDIIKDVSGCASSSDFQKLSTISQKQYILLLHQKGISIRQLNRLTGISRGVIYRTIKSL